MSAPTKLLDALAITTAKTAETSAPSDLGVGGFRSVMVEVDFVYGSGGTTAKVWVQTSFDGGVTWVDVVNLAATTASMRRLHTLQAATVVAAYAPTDGTLADNTVKDGLLGNLWRTKVTTTGTYAGGTTLTVRVQPR